MFRRGDDTDYYAILQVDPRAEPEVIEAAYRRLSRKYHPDVSVDPDAGRRMQDLNKAYQVLGDPGRRAAYDRSRSFTPGPSGGPRPLTLQDLLRPLRPYLLLAAVCLVGIRFLPLLLRPYILVPLVIAALVYVILRRLRHS